MIQNGGISFGIEIPAIEIISGVTLLLIVVLAVKNKEWRWIPVVIGGMLNLTERVRWGYVTDYWKIPLIPLYNNINDWLIFIGVGLLIWKYYTRTK